MSPRIRAIVPKFIRRSYSLKFAIILLVIGVSVGAIGVVGTAQIEDGVQSNVYENYETLALQQSEAVQEFHADNRRTVQSIARYSGLDSANQSEAQAYIDSEVADLDGGGAGEVNVHYLEENGDVVASSLVEPGTDLEGDWVDELDQQSGTYVTDAYQSGEYDDSTARVAYVTDSGDVPDGRVLVYTVPVSDYSISSTDGTRTMVVDSSGTVAFGETRSGLLEPYDESDELMSDADSLESGGMEAGPAQGVLATDDAFAGESYVVGYASVPGTDWVTLVHTPTEQAYGFVEDVRTYGTFATAGAVLLIGLVGAGFGWNTSRSIDRLTTKAARMEEGDLDVDLDSPRIDSIGRLYDGFDSMRDSLQTQIEETTQAREEAEAARAEAERLNDHLEAKADEYSDVMQTAADGDLTARMDPESENEAMTEIAAEFNDMIAEIEATTAEVKSFATEVATASEEVTASSEEVRSASGQVAESIQEISEGADRQNDSLQSVTQEMNGLSTTIEEIAASSNQVAELAERTAETGERGREAAQEAIEGMQEIETDSESAVEEIERLEEEMAQIDDLLEFITEVAEQTNMLALNANIEASRSSSSNEGFSAVAGEVKELAEDTREAAADIEDRLEQIKEQTDRTATEVQRTSDRVSEHTDSVERAADALDEIADYATETNTGVQEISNASDEQAASTQQVVAMVDDVAAIAEQTSSESETVAAAAEEQTTALTEVSRSAGELANRASHLSETLDNFETDADVEPGAAADLESEPEFDSDSVSDAGFDAADGDALETDLSNGTWSNEDDDSDAETVIGGTDGDDVIGGHGDDDDDGDAGFKLAEDAANESDEDVAEGDEVISFDESGVELNESDNEPDQSQKSAADAENADDTDPVDDAIEDAEAGDPEDDSEAVETDDGADPLSDSFQFDRSDDE
ncbi:methyl-accepting chemotaxis sensory transducer [Halopiger xanaduensis SH-6]|uniref:Methyl-accepting chemotaxis sensory transducer n=1 Tax=Halopiger xanaduensis (strain DSM 18323 / JCM 14033 / SH-6) TaxID=797210 RepID=F8D586_HALXS|nr:methyl-accepting chemotaxis sensory transducer [Halopiger xanaduensis SH-6]